MHVLGVGVPAQDYGLPWWQETGLTVLGTLVAFGILYGLYRLAMLPGARRFSKRVAAVEAAGGDDPVFGAATVKAAATSLFHEMQSAWDAGDRHRLATLSDPAAMAEWTPRLDAAEAEGERHRVAVLKGPQVDYVGIRDHEADGGDYVRLRVRAKVRCYLEQPDGERRPLPEAKGAQKLSLDEYWTLSRRGPEWIIYSTRPAEYGPGILAEEIVGPLHS